ncbi:hypothetical protein ACKKBG_A08455 [Auxenochlorella protothecoides x Auxenochlorella symbiontica]
MSQPSDVEDFHGEESDRELESTGTALEKAHKFAHHGFMDTTRERKYHAAVVSGLSRALSESGCSKDTVASFLATVLTSEYHESMDKKWQFAHPALHARYAEALDAGYNLLSSGQEHATLDQRKRFLRRAQSYHPAKDDRARVFLRLARLLLEHGGAAEAYDLLTSGDRLLERDSARQEVASLCGRIRHQQWTGAMADAWSRGRGVSTRTREEWDPVRNDPALVALAGRLARELATEGEAHLTTALTSGPASSAAAWPLMEILLTQGQMFKARSIASRLPEADADAAALRALLAFPTPDTKAAEEGFDAEEVVRNLVQILRSWPGNAEAASALLTLHTMQGPVVGLGQGLCLWLDVVGHPDLGAAPPDLVTRGWLGLATCLVQVGQGLCEAHAQHLEAGSGHSQGGAPQADTGASFLALQRAVAAWQECRAALDDRGWWLDAHLTRSSLGKPCRAEAGGWVPGALLVLKVLLRGESVNSSPPSSRTRLGIQDLEALLLEHIDVKMRLALRVDLATVSQAIRCEGC